MRVLVITGMSGSGKSTVVKALEDEGFYCIDNLPVRLFKQFVELIEKSKEQFRGTVLVTDIRGRDLSQGIIETFSDLRAAGHQLEVLFLDATDEVLIRRFQRPGADIRRMSTAPCRRGSGSSGNGWRSCDNTPPASSTHPNLMSISCGTG